MNRWWEEEGKWFSQTEENMAVGRALRVLDMAAGRWVLSLLTDYLLVNRGEARAKARSVEKPLCVC